MTVPPGSAAVEVPQGLMRLAPRVAEGHVPGAAKVTAAGLLSIGVEITDPDALSDLRGRAFPAHETAILVSGEALTTAAVSA